MIVELFPTVKVTLLAFGLAFSVPFIESGWTVQWYGYVPAP